MSYYPDTARLRICPRELQSTQKDVLNRGNNNTNNNKTTNNTLTGLLQAESNFKCIIKVI